MQTKRYSLIESITNIVIGYFIAFIGQLIIFPLIEIEIKINQNLIIGLYFMIISLCRSYLIRRFFAKRFE